MKTEHSTPTIEQVTTITPHNKALYEVGKSLLIESINSGREFCKFMIGNSVGAIPIYLGILTVLLPKDYTLGVTAGVFIIIPAIIFLVASTVFVFGYRPIVSDFSLDLPDEISNRINQIINERKNYIISGFSLFSLGTILAIFVVVANIGAR